MMLEWNPALIRNFEGPVMASSLMIETEQMLHSARYRFTQYNVLSASFEPDSSQQDRLSFVTHGEQNKNTDFFMVRDHPECFQPNRIKWKQLLTSE